MYVHTFYDNATDEALKSNTWPDWAAMLPRSTDAMVMPSLASIRNRPRAGSWISRVGIACARIPHNKYVIICCAIQHRQLLCRPAHLEDLLHLA